MDRNGHCLGQGGDGDTLPPADEGQILPEPLCLFGALGSGIEHAQSAAEETDYRGQIGKCGDPVLQQHLEEEFAKLSCTVRMYPSDSNFFLAKVTDAVKIYNYLVGEGIIVRNRHSISLCCNCLRVTVGTRVENNTLLAALKKYQG